MTAPGTSAPAPLCALALSGGLALGAFQAGAYATLHGTGPEPRWIAGVSIGAVNAALIAGNPPERRVERLRQFWSAAAQEPMPLTAFWFGAPLSGPLRRAESALGALQTHLLGCRSIFRPRLGIPRAGATDVPALYDLAPLRAQLAALIDFDRLNSGTPRVSIAATDILSGDRVTFDTARGDRIGPEHILASGSLLPLFPPVEVEGRLLGDGGFSGNLPLDLILDEPRREALLCFALELFARQGTRPQSLSTAAARALDLVFGNQSRQFVEARQREHKLRATLRHALPPDVRDTPEIAALLAEEPPQPATILALGYHAARDEAGVEKAFDFSRTTLTQRWEAGAVTMRHALRRLEELPPAEGLAFHEVAEPVGE